MQVTSLIVLWPMSLRIHRLLEFDCDCLIILVVLFGLWFTCCCWLFGVFACVDCLLV